MHSRSAVQTYNWILVFLDFFPADDPIEELSANEESEEEPMRHSDLEAKELSPRSTTQKRVGQGTLITNISSRLYLPFHAEIYCSS